MSKGKTVDRPAAGARWRGFTRRAGTGRSETFRFLTYRAGTYKRFRRVYPHWHESCDASSAYGLSVVLRSAPVRADSRMLPLHQSGSAGASSHAGEQRHRGQIAPLRADPDLELTIPVRGEVSPAPRWRPAADVDTAGRRGLCCLSLRGATPPGEIGRDPWRSLTLTENNRRRTCAPESRRTPASSIADACRGNFHGGPGPVLAGAARVLEGRGSRQYMRVSPLHPP